MSERQPASKKWRARFEQNVSTKARFISLAQKCSCEKRDESETRKVCFLSLTEVSSARENSSDEMERD